MVKDTIDLHTMRGRDGIRIKRFQPESAWLTWRDQGRKTFSDHPCVNFASIEPSQVGTLTVPPLWVSGTLERHLMVRRFLVSCDLPPRHQPVLFESLHLPTPWFGTLSVKVGFHSSSALGDVPARASMSEKRSNSLSCPSYFHHELE